MADAIRRLYRSRTNRKIAGVCGGLGEYFNVDPVFIRIVWVVLILGAGVGLLAYLICWLVIPNQPAPATG
jgi:phage shock protein PspC (stress-responsive transcriptional regulator)